MSKFRYLFFSLIGLMLLTFGSQFPIAAYGPTRPEVRALWVDAFHDGAKTPAQIDQLIQDAVTANINTLIVQVRRRGDAYYNQTIEPRTEDPDLAPGFDALEYLIAKAHANQIEVHAWLNTLVAWNSSVAPHDPNHVWNLHGPWTMDPANWSSYYRTYDKVSKSWSAELTSSYYLDPGHPAVIDYTVAVYLNVVKNYDIDGIHLDYSRYAGQGWGYNPVSLARYNAQQGTTGMPSPEDPAWAQWRREQTANLVRKIYLKAIAIKPKLKVSSAVITWGDGPVTADDWEKTRAYKDLAQDWRGWLEAGIIDMVLPMNYFREWNATEQLRYNQWIEWEKDHQYERQVIIGPGIFSQYLDESLEQIRRAQASSAQRNNVFGVALYAYGLTNLYSNDDFRDPDAAGGLPRQPHLYRPETNAWLFKLLSQTGGYCDPVSKAEITTVPVFPAPAVIPDMPWKSQPTKGYLMGRVADDSGRTFDHLRITVYSTNSVTPRSQREVYTDGSGWYGLAGLPPGEYRVRIEDKDFSGPRCHKVRVQAGQVAEVNFSTV